jgi:hypothetical protein
MKKLISCLLVVMMLFSAVGAFADTLQKKDDVITRFIDETDLNTKDIAIQLQYGNESADLVMRFDSGNMHFVTRENGAEKLHFQLTADGAYLGADNSVILLRYASIATVLQDIVKSVQSVVKETAKEIEANINKNSDKIEAAVEEIAKELPSEQELQEEAEKAAVVAAAVVDQAEADAVTLSSAAVSFALNFKPENVLDVKEEDGNVKISLRPEAYASALADAMDELMTNPQVAEVVDRYAELTGEKSFASMQKNWAKNREAVLETIKTIESSEELSEDGHYTSHFQIGEETVMTKALVSDTDAWIDAEGGEADITVSLGAKDEDPFMVYEFSVSPGYYKDKLTVGDDSYTDLRLGLNDYRINSGDVTTVIDGKELLYADFGPAYINIKGPNGGISSSIRETWTGKTRFELYVESDKGEDAHLIIDAYEEDDSLVVEIQDANSDGPSLLYKISRIDKIDIADLSAAENVTEITAEMITNMLESLLKLAKPADASEAGK